MIVSCLDSSGWLFILVVLKGLVGVRPTIGMNGIIDPAKKL